jgi:hypothetical protein
MDPRYIIATGAIALVILFLAGGVVSEQCVDIQGCKQCWKTYPVVVKSDYCPNSSECTAQPGAQQNNAVIDAVLCACSHVKSDGYSNANTNNQIENSVSMYLGYNLTVQDICEQPGFFLAKTLYE